MKHSLPTGRTGRLLALGLTSLALAVLWLGIVMPLIAWHSDRTEALAHQEVLTQRMEAESDTMASASLQERLQGMFMQAGVQLNSVETLPGDDAGAYRRIGLRISFNASWPVLMTVLKEMHVATPSLLVDELQVTPALHRISTAPGSFDVACAIFAFRSASPAKVAAR